MSDKTIQLLMNKIYELQQDLKLKNEIFSKGAFLIIIEDELGELYRHVKIVGDLHYEILNGGFSQWYENGYSFSIEELIDFFDEKFEGNETIKKLLEILKDVDEIIFWIKEGNNLVEGIGNFNYTEFFTECLEEKGCEDLQKLDSRYYDISKDITNILEDYFKKKLGE